MKLEKLLFLAAFLSLFASCRQDVFPEIEKSNQQLVVIAEIEEDVLPIEFIVSTTFSVNSAPFPLDQDKTFLTIGDPVVQGGEYTPREFRGIDGDSTGFRFDDTTGFRPKPGLTYSLNLKAEDTDFETLDAETTMPFPGEFNGVPQVNLISQNAQFTEFETTVSLSAPPDSESFYHIIPYLKANDGSELYPDINTISQGLNASFVLSHRHGMLIDYSKIDDSSPLSFTLRTISPINIDQLSDRNMYYKLCTVTENYYMYHRSVSRIYETDKSPFTLPVVSYTQFDNGYGIFTALSSKTEKAVIQ